MMYRLSALGATVLACLMMSGQEGFWYVENKGQWPDQVVARVQTGTATVHVEADGLTYSLLDPEWVGAQHPGLGDPNIPFRAHHFRMQLMGSQPPQSELKHTASFYHNYYLGSDPSGWASHCALAGRVHLNGVYPNIDLQLHSRSSNLKYDFVVRPGGDPADIAFGYEGLDYVRLESGSLHLGTSLRELVELEPYAYQVVDGKMITVDCNYILEEGIVQFQLGEYSTEHTLVIDPEVVFASYIGSASYNFGFTAANDSEDNLIAGAIVFGNQYPTTFGAEQAAFNGSPNNYCDAAISKFSADGTQLLYSTFLGGSRADMPHSIICDSQDNWIVMGNTGSHDFPISAGAYQPANAGGPLMNYSDYLFASAVCPEGVDMWLAKFAADGTGMLASTYVGGTDTDGLNGGNELLYNYGDCFRGEVIVDEQDRILVCSTTESQDFPMPGNNGAFSAYGGGNFDGVLFRMSSDLSAMDWATYLGGSMADSGYSVQLASDGDVIVTGGTRSIDFPTTPGADDTAFGGDADGYILRFNADASVLEAGTFVGTQSYDQCYFVQLDLNEDIYVIGQTEGNMVHSPGVYGTPNSGQFIRKYNASLTGLDWSTTVGTGSGAIDFSPTAFLVSDCDQIYFAGWGGETNASNSLAISSSTSGLEVTPDAFQATTDGSDFYLAVLSANAEDLVYATFLGGNISTEHVDGGTAKFDKSGAVYQAVCAGCGGNSDFPTTAGAYSEGNGSTHCNLAVFKFDLGKLIAEIDAPTEICEGQPIDFDNLSVGGSVYDWDFGDAAGSDQWEPGHVYESNGTFEVEFILSDQYDCLEPDTATLVINVLPGVDPSATNPDPICPGASVQLQADGSGNLYWLEDPTLSATDISNPIATPAEPTVYYAVDFNDCEADTIPVEVSFVEFNTEVGPEATICIGESIPLTASGGVFYTWYPPEFLSGSVGTNVLATPTETTTFFVDILTEEGCETLDSVLITVDTDLPGGLVYTPETICFGSSVVLQAESGLNWEWSPPEGLSNTGIQNPSASPSDTTTYFIQIFNACGSGVSQVTVNVIVPEVMAGDDGTICLGEWHPVWASDAVSWSWSPPQFTSDPGGQYISVSPPSSQQFVVTATDQYGCEVSDSVYVTVLPLPEVTIADPGAVNWLDDVIIQGYTSEAEFSWSPPDVLSCTDCLDPEVYLEEPVWIYLQATDDNGCTGRDSLLIELIYPLYVPNAFTPDGDGINDVFFASGEGITGFHMRIVDRWGNLVFESWDIHDVWNGSFQGGDHFVQNDVYIWTIDYDGPNGTPAQAQGHVTLVR